jgi:hypothetical protein
MPKQSPRFISFALQLVALTLGFAFLTGAGTRAAAHGGVAFEDDRCVIRIDFLTAHFTVYQPQARGSREYCEDLPDAADTIFVMEYLHDFLREMPVDFRIIRDATGIGRFAKWSDIEAIPDLDAVTVFYQPAQIHRQGELSASHTFDQKGTYIGIVTALHPNDGRQYNAVFHFQAGGPDYGTIPLFVGILLLLQAGYWLSNGGWQRIRRRGATAP